MKRPKRSFWKKLATGIVLGVAGLVNTVSGADSGTLCNPVTLDNFLTNNYSVRTRIENFEGEDKHLNKSTFGVAPVNGKYNRFKEIFRSYHFNGEQNGKDIDWNSYGAIIPKFKTGNLEHSISIFGETGDKQGVGMEGITSFGSLDLFLNIEENFSRDSTRRGLGFEYGFGEEWNFGAGVDTVSTAEGDTNYWFGKTIWNVDENHQIGGGIRLSDNEIGTNRLGTYVMRHGDVSWGNRTFFVYDWKDDSEMIWFKSTLAQNPAYSKNGSGPAFVGRNQGYILSPHVINSPVTTIEPPTVVERSKKGLVLGVDGKITDTGESRGFIGHYLGYQFGDFGIYGSYKNGIGGVDDSYGPHAVWHLGPVKLEGNYDFENNRSYASLSAYIPIK
jgi:hypothetical protein